MRAAQLLRRAESGSSLALQLRASSLLQAPPAPSQRRKQHSDANPGPTGPPSEAPQVRLPFEAPLGCEASLGVEAPLPCYWVSGEPTRGSTGGPPVPELLVSRVACQRNEETIFRDVSMTVHQGGAMLLTGPNGSGKSSMLRLVRHGPHPPSHKSHAASHALSPAVKRSTPRVVGHGCTCPRHYPFSRKSQVTIGMSQATP